MDYIRVEKNAIPYHADIRIEGTTYTFTFNYNSEGDFFTVDLEQNGEILARGEKVVYGSPLFLSVVDGRFPKRPIVPFDPAGEKDRVGWKELGEDVFLFVPEV